MTKRNSISSTLILLSLIFFECTGNNPTSFFVPKPSENSWHFLNPYPTGNSLFDVEYSNHNTIWAVGSSATLIRSTDGGNSWSLMPSLPSSAYSLSFSDSRNCWAVGNEGMIVHTSNGGNTWRKQTSGVKQNLFSVYFLDNEYGWAAGANGTVVRTENGGMTWEFVQLNSGFFISDIKFRNKSEGWAVGSSRRTFPLDLVLHSTDGGKNWTRVDVGVPEDLGNPDPTFWDEVSADFNAVAMDGEDEITIVGFAYQGGLLGGIIVQSNDGGKTWNVELTNGEYSDVTYVTESGMSSRKLFGSRHLPFQQSDPIENPVIF